MRAIEFETQVDDSGYLSVPKEAAADLPAGTLARVIVLVPDGYGTDSRTWDHFAGRTISEYYAPEDAVYDDYPRERA